MSEPITNPLTGALPLAESLARSWWGYRRSALLLGMAAGVAYWGALARSANAASTLGHEMLAQVVHGGDPKRRRV